MMQNKDALIVSIFTLITVLTWIVFDVYHAAVTSTITEVQERLMAPLDPKIDEETLVQIRFRSRN